MAKLGTGKVLTAAERAMADRVPELGARLVENIPRLGPVGRIIRYQNKGFDGSGFPLDEVRGEQIPLGARILKAVSDFTDRLDTRKDAHVITESMKLHGEVYDPAVLEELEKHLVALTPSQGSAPERVVTVAELCEGMVLSQDVRHHSGQLVLSAGLRLGGPYLEILKTLGELMGIQEPIHVRGH
jgi:HD-GYP domain-containing protein (c-di-GMP phosphodiesterase class II)